MRIFEKKTTLSHARMQNLSNYMVFFNKPELTSKFSTGFQILYDKILRTQMSQSLKRLWK